MKRFLKTACALLVAPILVASSFTAFAANDTNNATVAADEKVKIEKVVHEYILQKPEVLIESLQNFQRKQMEQAEKTVKETQKVAPKYSDNLFHQASDPVAGNPNGKITIVEFFDYQCPHCVDMVPTMNAIIKANPQLRVVYKEWPIRGPISEFAAKAALAANKQGKYEIYSHALLKAKPPLDQNKILDTAKQVGLDVEKLKTDMNDSSVQKQVEANTKLAQDLQLFGTPAFFIGLTNNNGSIAYVPGQLSQSQLQEVLNKIK